MFRPNSPHTVGRGGTRGSARSGTGSKDPGIARRSPSSLPSSFKVAHLGSDRRDQTQDRWGASSPRLWKFRPIHGSRIQGQAARVGERRGLQGLRVRAMGGGDEWSDEEGGDVPSTQAEEFGPAPEPSTSGRRNAVSRHEVGVPSTPPGSGLPRPRFSLLTRLFSRLSRARIRPRGPRGTVSSTSTLGRASRGWISTCTGASSTTM